MKKYQIFLASNSPRRKELMQWTYLPFEVHVSGIEENSQYVKPHEYVQDLAYQKAFDVFSKLNNPHAFVIGADTTVVLNNEIINKPKDSIEAKMILSKLSGKTHEVFTGVCFVFQKDSQVVIHKFFDKTSVTFGIIENDLLELYVQTGESLDKAGAYGIQGKALGFIERINGSYSNVVGFPLDKVLKNIKIALGYNDDQGLFRHHF